MNNYKIKVNNEAESKEAQELFFELGYYWNNGLKVKNLDAKFLYAKNNQITMSYCSDHFSDSGCCELTLPQLRDLVVLHRKDVKDATHTDGERKGFLSSDGVEYFWNAYDLEWFKAKQMTFAYEKFKPIQEQGLISGADALRALADGKEVQCTITGKNDWTKDIYGIQPYYFLGGGVGQFQFRLKPRTIKLELEIPAPFEPSECEEFYVLSSVQPTGYIRTHLKSHALLGAWHIEEEIKQVVEALRGGIKA